MKLLSFRTGTDGDLRVGGLLQPGLVLDLRQGYDYLRRHEQQAFETRTESDLNPAYFAGDLLALLRYGDVGLSAAANVLSRVHSLVTLSPNSEVGLYPEKEIIFEPVIPRPEKVVATGWNFADHISETQELVSAEVPSFPTGFIKLPSALTGHMRPIVIPKDVAHVDYEIEMAVVIGKYAYRVAEAEANDFIAGYTILNDVSARDLQTVEMKAGLLLGGKNFNTFGPLGPYLITKDEVPDSQALQMELRVNGEVRQSSNTRTMVKNFAQLVSYWSSLFPLQVGDIISSGTPPGVAFGYPAEEAERYYLCATDVVEAEIENLGTLVNFVQSEGEVDTGSL